MDSPESGRPSPGPTRRVWRPILGVSIVAIVAAGAVVYLARDRIAAAFARAWLGEHGVAADVTLRSLSMSGFSAAIQFGDPHNPDLTVERLDVGYALAGPWNGKSFGVETHSLRLVRPRLRLRLANGRLNFGALQPLIDEAAKHPAGAGPKPDVTVEDGDLLIVSQGGDLHLHGDGRMRAGVLVAANGRLAPFRIGDGALHAAGAGGVVDVSQHGAALHAQAALGQLDVQNQGGEVHGAKSTLVADLPAPGRGGRMAGPVTLTLSVGSLTGKAGDFSADGATLNASLTGNLSAGPARQSFTGEAQASARVASANWRDAHVGGGAQLSLARLTLSRAADGVTMTGAAKAEAAFAGAAFAGLQASRLTAAAQIADLRLRLNPAMTLTSAALSGSVAGEAAFAPRSAQDLARKVPVLSDQPAYASAIARGLGDVRVSAPSWRVSFSGRSGQVAFAAPMQAATASGARLTLADGDSRLGFSAQGAQGATNLALEGGGMPRLKLRVTNAAVAGTGFQADIAAQGVLDALFARELALQIKGRVSGAANRFRFDLAQCTPLSAERLVFDPNVVAGFTATLCPGAGPLITASPAGWTAQGRLQDASGLAPGFSVDFDGARGAFQAAGDAKGPQTAALALDAVRITDASSPIRFRPLALQGQIGLGGGAWTGAISARTTAGHFVGEVRLRHDVASGVGRADIDAGALRFAPGGLQPSELTPLAAVARDADGPAAFKGWLAWGPRGQASSGGDLTAMNLKFKSPLGPVLDIDSHLHFVSLNPLVTAPGQSITVDRVEAITPLSGLATVFALAADSIDVRTANGSVAGGHIRLEPFSAPLDPAKGFSGVLVVDHVNLGAILAASSLADTVKMDAVVDGRIPFQFGPSGLTIQNGRLVAVGPGRISISRKALSGASSATGQVGFAQDIAYQAMENLAFDQLDAALGTQPADRLGVLFHIKGRHDPPQRQRATIAVGDLMRGQPLAKPIALPSNTKIDLTLDTSLNFGELVRALEQAWRDSMQSAPELHGSRPVQDEAATMTHK